MKKLSNLYLATNEALGDLEAVMWEADRRAIEAAEALADALAKPGDEKERRLIEAVTVARQALQPLAQVHQKLTDALFEDIVEVEFDPDE